MAKKKTTRAGARKKVRRKRRAKRGLATVSIADLHSELTRRLEVLQARRDELAEELEALDEEISGYGGGVTPAPRRRRRVGRPAKKKKRVGRPAKKKKKRVGRPAKKKKRVTRRKTKKKKKKTGRRPRNTGSLVESLKRLLKGRTMSVTQMADAVQKAGYKTSSPNFRTIVNQTLINNKKDFKRVARGQYTAK